ncbi:protein of unknown function [Cupriavidus taiwanensis]|nr:protein of unknown function [Cupriavidus taiwanensis]
MCIRCLLGLSVCGERGSCLGLFLPAVSNVASSCESRTGRKFRSCVGRQAIMHRSVSTGRIDVRGTQTLPKITLRTCVQLLTERSRWRCPNDAIGNCQWRFGDDRANDPGDACSGVAGRGRHLAAPGRRAPPCGPGTGGPEPDAGAVDGGEPGFSLKTGLSRCRCEAVEAVFPFSADKALQGCGISAARLDYVHFVTIECCLLQKM